MNILRVVTRTVFVAIAFLLTALVGSWRPPGWLRWSSNTAGRAAGAAGRRVNRFRVESPRGFYRSAGATVLILVSSWLVWDWYRHLPVPYKLSVWGTHPQPTRLEKDREPVPEPLVLHFSGSAAPLEKIGKPVTEGVAIEPPIEGSWRWSSDSELVFTVKGDWTVGEHYTVKFDRKLFPSHVLLEHYEFPFRSPPFAASVEETTFYQDPVDPHVKKVVSTVHFTHPVDRSDFEKRLRMRLRVEPAKSFDESGVSPLAFKVTYSELGTDAYVHSEKIAIPPQDGQVLFEVLEGSRAARGGPGLTTAMQRTVSIPGVDTYFRISGVSGAIVKDEKQNPEHVVNFSFTSPTTIREVIEHTEVYLLPKDRPAIGDRAAEEDYGWNDAGEIVAEVLAKAVPVKPFWIPTEKDFADVVSFRYEAPINSYLFVKVNKGAKSADGYALAKDVGTVLLVEDYPQELNLGGSGALLAVTGDKKLSVTARNLKSIKFKLNRILPRALHHLVTQSSGSFGHPSFENYSFGLENLAEVYTEEVPLAQEKPGTLQYAVFDFGRFHATVTDIPRGLFVLQAESWDPVTKSSTGVTDERLVLLTDLGFVVKDSDDGSHDIFVQSLSSGDPIEGASVQILGRNGEPAFSAMTGPDGAAKLPTFKGLEREKGPTVYVVSKGDDLSFLPYGRSDRMLDLSRFDVGGLYTSSLTKDLQAYLFSDRGIYRPGETVSIGMIVKNNSWQPLLAEIPFEVAVTDPRGVEVLRRPVRFSGVGFEDLKYETLETSLTGTYSFSLSLIGDREQRVLLGTASARVEDFLPDRMTIKGGFEPLGVKGWMSPEKLAARFTLRNLYGAPAIEHTVKAVMRLSPSMPAFSGFSGYTFFDPSRAKKSFQEELGEIKTDEHGDALYDPQLARFERATYRVQIVAEGFEADGGRSVSTEIVGLVSPREYMVGWKADGDLSYIKRGVEQVVELVAVDSELRQVPVSKLVREVVEIKNVSVLTKQPNETFAYQSVRKEMIKEKGEFDVGAAGTKFSLDSRTPGDFAIVLRAADGTELNRIGYSVVGEDNAHGGVQRDAELKIKLNKRDFSAGEEIELEIQSPYTGAGIITIERDKVYAHRWFKAGTLNSIQRITVPEGLEGNGYVNVTFIRALDSREIFMSPLSFGVEPFSVSRERRTLKVELESAPLIEPGNKLTVGYSTSVPSRIVVIGVDEGILQVARYRTPDPLSHFFRKRALEVRTSQILDLLLPEYLIVQSIAATGGDEDDALTRNLNPFKRRRQKPVAFYSGILDAGPERQSVDIQIPDYFNGTVRLFAVAVSDSGIGVSERKTEVRGPVIITPTSPAFVTPGDEFELSAVVANNLEGSGDAQSIDVAVEPGFQLEVIGDARRTETIPEGRDRAVRFKLRARDALGEAHVTVRATAGAKSATYTLYLSIRPASALMATSQSGFVGAGMLMSGSVEVASKRELFSELSSRTLAISSVPLVLTQGLVQYLEAFPHGCTEQIVSQAMPGMVLGSRPEFKIPRDRAERSVSRALATLHARQNADGSFGLWFAGADVVPVASLYAAQFLVEAKDRGYNVPPEILRSVTAYLRKEGSFRARQPAEFRHQAFAAYVLTRLGMTASSELARFRENLRDAKMEGQLNDVTGLYLAAAYKMMKMDEEAETALKQFSPRAPLDSLDYMFDSLAQRSLRVFIVSKHFPEKLNSITAEEIQAIAGEIERGTYTTFSSAFAILALDAYAGANAESSGLDARVYGVTATDESRSIDMPREGIVRMSDFSEGFKKLRIETDGRLPLFYQLTESGFDLHPPMDALKDRIELIREYRNSAGQVVTNLEQGQDVWVHIIVRSLDRSALRQVAVTDLLPSGLEVDIKDAALTARTSLPGEGLLWRPVYIDVREDRILLYGDVPDAAHRFVYKAKAVSPGDFVIPPVLAEGMYDRSIRGRSHGGKLTISE